MKFQGVIAAMVTPYADEHCTISPERIKVKPPLRNITMEELEVLERDLRRLRLL